MDIDTVDQQTRLLVDAGHRVLQIHRFAKDEAAHVARLERWAEFSHGSRVLDMGSGTGEVARIMQELRPDLEFTLVNISQAQLDYSPKHMRQHLGSFCNLPMPDQSYDAVMFCFCWRRPKIDPPCRSKFDPGRGAAFLSSSCG